MIDDHYVSINKMVVQIQKGDDLPLSELFSYYKPLILSAINRCCNKEKNLNSYREEIGRAHV